jgi:hypothetical protein
MPTQEFNKIHMQSKQQEINTELFLLTLTSGYKNKGI